MEPVDGFFKAGSCRAVDVDRAVSFKGNGQIAWCGVNAVAAKECFGVSGFFDG